jgi:tetratricopeptide (TPR) repeat protein
MNQRSIQHAIRLESGRFRDVLKDDHLNKSQYDDLVSLGNLWLYQGEFLRSEQMYQRALAGYKEALEPDHTSTLRTVNNLGILYRDQGKLVEAEEMYQRALAGYEKALGPDHPSMLRTVDNLGALYGEHERLAKYIKFAYIWRTQSTILLGSLGRMLLKHSDETCCE